VGERHQLCSGTRGDPLGPADQERHPCRRLEETLFLPGVVIAEVLAVIREETDDGVVGFVSMLDCVEYPAQAMVDVGDLAVVAGLEDTCVAVADVSGPR